MPHLSNEAIDRFLSRIEKSDGCWMWKGLLQPPALPLRYGIFCFNNGDYMAHRISWQIHNGPIPEGLCVLHHCDVPACVRPDHLFLGTRADNNADKFAKGRAGGPKGEENPAARLTERDVVRIREVFALGNISQVQLGKQFHVSRSLISAIVRGEAWPNVDGPRSPRPDVVAVSGYRGVSYQRVRGDFRVMIRFSGRQHYLGTFRDPLTAALVYDAKAREVHGSNARLNFPE